MPETDPRTIKLPAGRILTGHRLRVSRVPSAELTAAAIDAIREAGLADREGTAPPADLLVIAVPPGTGNGALNVALAAIDLDLLGDGAELERRLYAPAPSDG